jgi:transcriptional regulator with XRE-family HTH domain
MTAHLPEPPDSGPVDPGSVDRPSPLAQAEVSARLVELWSQAELARRSGVSLRTVVRLESGASAQLAKWLQVLDAMGWSDALFEALPDGGPSPIEQLEARGSQRLRSRSRGETTDDEPWSWDLSGADADEEPGTDDDRR